jgi:AbrB family looped-hinge helix DNA binding protein
MALIKLRVRGQITLPREIREALKLREGDDLEIEVVEGGVLLKPSDTTARDAAWKRIRKSQGAVRPTPAQAAKEVEKQEREILEVVDQTRREYAEELRRR